MSIKNARFLPKRTSVSGRMPTGTTGDENSFIKQGEIAVNTADKKIFSYDGSNIFEFGENSFLGLSGGTINGNLSIQGSETETQNLTVHGNMIIEGTSFTSHTENIYISANTITLNYDEINSGITKGYAGILVDRGIATQYEFAFEESSDTFRIGETGNTQAVATREDSPINGGYAYWNENEYKFDTTKDLSATTMSLSTISADTLYSGSTNLNSIIASFATPPGGSNTYIQYNSNGVFSGDTGFTYSSANKLVTIAESSILFSGTVGTTPTSGAGTRLMWIPAKKALRAGTVTDYWWDNSYIGNYSVVFGEGGLGAGVYTLTSGLKCQANGEYSIVNGYYNVANGGRSAIINGALNTTNANYSCIINGLSNTTSGEYNIVGGQYITTQAYNSFAFGRYNIIAGTTGEWISTDPLFQIGNGGGTGVASNDAFRLNKDASGWIRSGSTTNGIYFTGQGNLTASTISVTTLNAGTIYSGSTNLNSIIASFATPPGGSNTQIQYNSNGVFSGDTGFTYSSTNKLVTVAESSILFSGTVGTTPTSGAGTRLMWVPAKAAFRAGYVSDAYPSYEDVWNDANIGTGSFAFGWSTKAYGTYSTAGGYLSWAAGNYSIAIGNNTSAPGAESAAFCHQTTASGLGSFAAGYGAQGTNTAAIGIGYVSVAQGLASMAANLFTNAKSYANTALGRYNESVGTSDSWISTDPLFQIGNGSGTGTASNDAFRLNKDASGWIRSGSTLAPILYWTKDGLVGIGTELPTSTLTVSGNTTITGDLVASTKSFVIPHPTKEGKKLHYGSLEGPEHGVYYRGRLKKNNVIELPEYWEKLVDEDSISVELTPIGNYQKLFIKSISNNKIYVGNKNWFNKNIDCYFTVFAMREKINVEE